MISTGVYFQSEEASTGFVKFSPQCILCAGQNKSLPMLPHSGANLLPHSISFGRAFGACILGVQLYSLSAPKAMTILQAFSQLL
jgi:hypothetical protein